MEDADISVLYPREAFYQPLRFQGSSYVFLEADLLSVNKKVDIWSHLHFVVFVKIPSVIVCAAS